MNPRYLAYCKANNNIPKIQMKKDINEYPGGKMCGFILWISQKWEEFGKTQGWKHSHYNYIKTEAIYTSFDRFIGIEQKL